MFAGAGGAEQDPRARAGVIRIAADTHHPYRADALAEASSPARTRHVGVASRDELLLHPGDTPVRRPLR
ncbi:hypothetical protein [Streptomyces virginiae]|uniref:hypothetical protein n=1 Tax=Streptomyces virginiae TaxID=1961 RepID=UPI0022509ACF|nr:hypothetical protein [Streptomyces virginiae]MCX4960196.1 hypothetical protein [Streptomyces virginiae]